MLIIAAIVLVGLWLIVRSVSRRSRIPQGSVESGDWYDLVGPGRYDVHVAGASHYQDALLAICGGKRTKTGRHLKVTASLAFEPGNPHDRNAVRVEIKDNLVGYLPREVAIAFHKAVAGHGSLYRAKGMIVGGWHNEADEGSFGVRLDI